MPHYDFFNGDADGICALQQLRLNHPIDSTLVSGVKRDIGLLKKVDPQQVSSATVLDISFDKNRAGVQALLDANVPVQYFDHHFAGEVPSHRQLDAHIDTAANTCTSLLVNAYLNGAHLPWAVVAAFGDNLHASAQAAAKPLGLSKPQIDALEQLGTLINYNGYGAHIDDLFFDPETLYKTIHHYPNPFDFISSDTAFITLRDGYAGDIDNARQLAPVQANDCGLILVLPEEKWSRRISGVYANELARAHPDRAHALLNILPAGGYLVSVRAPLNRKHGADTLCMQFETGGGRKAAAGINHLPTQDIEHFIEKFNRQFSQSG